MQRTSLRQRTVVIAQYGWEISIVRAVELRSGYRLQATAEASAEATSHMATVRAELSKATETLNVLRAEIVRCIQGESAFSQDTLAGLSRDSEAKCSELRNQYEEAEAAVLSEEQLLNHLTDQYEELISWADLYDHATFEAKKMIVNCMIRRVEVFRDYKLNVEFNFDLNQFLNGLDISA